MHADAEDTEIRRILTDDDHTTAYHRAQDIALQHGHQLTYPETIELVAAVLAAAGILTPPPTPNPDTCIAQFADENGDWWQCIHNPGHPGIYHLTEGDEYSWTDGTPGTVPARPQPDAPRPPSSRKDTTAMTETPGFRILTDDEYGAAYARLTAQARLHGNRLGTNTAHAALTAALAAITVYGPAPEPEPDTCTALYLPTNAKEYGPDILGVWQQCMFEPGHDDTDDHESDCGWSDDMPGAIPARTTHQEA